MSQDTPADNQAPSAELDVRVTELESRLAHQESILDDLNGIVVKQHHEIDLLTRKITLLLQRFRDMERGGDALPANDGPPPHY